MSAATPWRRTGRALRHLTRDRAVEVLVLQASPLLGAAFGGLSATAPALMRQLWLLFGSLLLTAHVFVFNDWAGWSGDRNDPHRVATSSARHGIRSGDVAALAVGLLAIAMVALGALGFSALLLGAAIACLGLVYSGSRSPAKGVPVLASLTHLLGGELHFLLGYSTARAIDGRGLAIGLFFGLVFAAGHLNQEVRDREADVRNGIHTSAVVFGARRAALASLVAFTAAYAELVLLAASGLVPATVAWAAFLWPFHLVWSLRAMRAGLDFEHACWVQRRYRLLFALVGALMALSLLRSGAVTW